MKKEFDVVAADDSFRDLRDPADLEQPLAASKREDRLSLYPLTKENISHGEGIVINPDIPMTNRDEVLDEIAYHCRGLRASPIAVINAGHSEFVVLDTRYSDMVRVPFMLTQPTDSDQGSDAWGLKGIWPDETLTVGREYWNDRFAYTDHESRRHFAITWSPKKNALAIADCDSTNGTIVTHRTGEDSSRNEISSDFTKMVKTRLFSDTYRGYPLIGRDSPVEGGVYGTAHSEMVLVDNESPITHRAVMDVLMAVREEGSYQTMDTIATLSVIEEEVRERLHYDRGKIEKMCEPYYYAKDMMFLSEFIEEGVGVCRQQCLLAALCISEAVNQQLLSDGVARVERNTSRKYHESHAWAVYRKTGGQEYIVDAAHAVVKPRKEARWRASWPYCVE